jgi:hypothetical protein
VWPPRVAGKRAPLDLEATLGLPGTMRTLRVVKAIDARLRDA